MSLVENILSETRTERRADKLEPGGVVQKELARKKQK